MSKNHVKRNGHLTQTNKKWSHLKMRQREWILELVREEHQKYIQKHQRLPSMIIIVEAVKEKVDEREIWLPFHELKNAVSKYIDRLNRKTNL